MPTERRQRSHIDSATQNAMINPVLNKQTTLRIGLHPISETNKRLRQRTKPLLHMLTTSAGKELDPLLNMLISPIFLKSILSLLTPLSSIISR
jgi:hypothetical protein